MTHFGYFLGFSVIDFLPFPHPSMFVDHHVASLHLDIIDHLRWGLSIPQANIGQLPQLLQQIADTVSLTIHIVGLIEDVAVYDGSRVKEM